MATKRQGRDSGDPNVSFWTESGQPWRERFALPDAPFARLGLVHALAAFGDTLVAIALAKTLFFVQPTEARNKVLLYLLLTLAPFAVVSPFVGPLIDRFATQRKHVLITVLAVRFIICLFLARDHGNYFLFPEAFTLLVLSKAYAIARNSIVPSVVTRSSELVKANSKLALIAGLSGFVAAGPGGLASLAGPGWVVLLAALSFAAAALLAARMIVSNRPLVGEESQTHQHPRNQWVASSGDDSKPRFNGARTSATRRPGRQLGSDGLWTNPERFMSGVRLASWGVGAQRGLIGMISFLIAFDLKRSGAPTVWLGASVAAGVAGSLLGSMLTTRLHQRFNELWMAYGGLPLAAAASVAAGLIDTRVAACAAAFCFSFAAAFGRLGFDALLQRFVPDSQRGATYAKAETKFQLAWVAGALVPVVFRLQRNTGFYVMASVCVLMFLVVVSGEAALRRGDDIGLRMAGQSWTKRHSFGDPDSDDWEQ